MSSRWDQEQVPLQIIAAGRARPKSRVTTTKVSIILGWKLRYNCDAIGMNPKLDGQSFDFLNCLFVLNIHCLWVGINY